MEKIFKYIVYKTTNIVNNYIYIGVHKVIDPDIFDGYIGNDIFVNKPSSYKNRKELLPRAVQKYGIKNFIRQTIKIFDHLEDALDLERWLVDQNFVNRKDTYNMILGGKWFCPTNSKNIYVYNIKTQQVYNFNSYSDASIFVYGNNKRIGNITRALNNSFLCNKQYFVSKYKINDFKEIYKQLEYRKQKFQNLYLEKKDKSKYFSMSQKIIRYDSDMNIICIYQSINDAKRDGFTNVHQVLLGNRKTCKGCFFKYYKE